MSRSYGYDFLAGVDPTGASTFQYGLDDGLEGNASSARRAVGTAGGVAGGTLLIPALAGGVTGLFKGIARGKPGVAGRLLGAGRGLLQGVVDPYTKLYNAAQARRGLRSIQQGGNMTSRQLAAANKLAPKSVLTHPLAGFAPLQDPARASGLLRSLPTSSLSGLDNAIKGQLTGAAGAFGVSGALGGLSAGLQYGKGVETGERFAPGQKLVRQQQAQQQTQPQQPLKTAAYRRGVADALKLAAAEDITEQIQKDTQKKLPGDLLRGGIFGGIGGAALGLRAKRPGVGGLLGAGIGAGVGGLMNYADRVGAQDKAEEYQERFDKLLQDKDIDATLPLGSDLAYSGIVRELNKERQAKKNRATLAGAALGAGLGGVGMGPLGAVTGPVIGGILGRRFSHMRSLQDPYRIPSAYLKKPLEESNDRFVAGEHDDNWARWEASGGEKEMLRRIRSGELAPEDEVDYTRRNFYGRETDA